MDEWLIMIQALKLPQVAIKGEPVVKTQEESSTEEPFGMFYAPSCLRRPSLRLIIITVNI